MSSVRPIDLHMNQPSAQATAQPGNPETPNMRWSTKLAWRLRLLAVYVPRLPPYTDGADVRGLSPNPADCADTSKQRTAVVIDGGDRPLKYGDAESALDSPTLRDRAGGEISRVRDNCRCGAWLRRPIKRSGTATCRRFHRDVRAQSEKETFRGAAWVIRIIWQLVESGAKPRLLYPMRGSARARRKIMTTRPLDSQYRANWTPHPPP